MRASFMRPPSLITPGLIRHLVFVFLAILLVPMIYAGQEEFREHLNQAKALKGDIAKSTSNFVPENVFTNYSSNPGTTKYYSEDSAGASQTLKSDSVVAITTNKEGAGETIAQSSKSRPKFKIESTSPEIARSKEIQNLASKNIKGVVDGFISGKEDQINTTVTKYVIKTCNEEIRPLKRICDKTPVVTTSLKSNLYPNCRKLILVEGNLESNGLCPPGYITSNYMYMIRFSGPNVRFCTKQITINEGTECFGGFFGAGIMHGDYRQSGTGRVIVPKKRHSRIKISHAYSRTIFGTIVNNTTGAVLYNEATFYNGQTIELPYSETQDQDFSFYAVFGRGFFCYRPLGIMTAHIDHEYQDPIANISWKEECRDV